jgi:hypothetical protein
MIRTDNGIITAVVYGTDDYDVEITIDDEQILDMDCSCPYAEDGNSCKHMAAVLYTYKNNTVINEKQINKSATVSAATLVSEASEDNVRKFLVQTLEGDEKLLIRFKSLISPNISINDMKRYKEQIDKKLRKYQGRSGFIEYGIARDFIRAMEEFLYEDVQTMLDNDFYIEAFELTNYVFVTVGNVDIDDSDGGTGMLSEHCYEIWQDIINTVDIDDKRYIFDWFISHMNGSVIDYMEDYIEQIVMEEFTEDEFMQEKMIFIDKKVTDAEKNDDSWRRDYYSGKWAIIYINMMESGGSTWDDIEQYCKKHWSSSAVRKYYIDRCVKCKEYDKAIDVLQESLKIDSALRGLVNDYSMKLKDIYQLCGKTEKYVEQLWQLVTLHSPGSLELYKELKDQYEETEWVLLREKIFSALPSHSGIDKLFREEGLYDRLMTYVKNSFGLYALGAHKDILIKHYPDEILEKYKNEVESMASKPSDRKRYKELASILKSMKKIPGGEKVVSQILIHWRVNYSNRPAMMDELKRL